MEEEDYSDNTNDQSTADGQIDKPQEVQKRKMEVCDDLSRPQTSRWLMEANRGSVNYMEYANSRGIHNGRAAHIKQEPEKGDLHFGAIDSKDEKDYKILFCYRSNHQGDAADTTADPDDDANQTAECAVVIKTESVDLEQYSGGDYGPDSRDGSIDRLYPSGYENQDAEDSNSGCVANVDCGSFRQRSLGRGIHPEVGSGTSRVDQYDCSRCGYVSLDQWHLQTHLCSDIGENVFRCGYCEYRTSNSTNLTTHMSRHSGLKRYQCSYCDFSAADKTHLKIHTYKHSGERPFKCNLCDYSTIDRTYLRNHMYKHSGEKPFKCNLCDYRAAVKSQLRPHMFTHTGEKRFVCGVCDYRTAVKSNLKTHMYTHTGERPFKCQMCEYKCSNSSALKAHVRTHTGEKPFKNNKIRIVCNAGTTAEDHLKRKKSIN
ncbi:hypothetical protein J437_LFUL017325 [Ladona fulva]|uniref:C2H2-type domain-containing protein n=1 Tax=Ladona fulva TaxID=123851 RepID=A0A8K0KLM5_LADFU|nr:hypothetical protein J437_LFUL017325 [Ladona fulva]